MKFWQQYFHCLFHWHQAETHYIGRKVTWRGCNNCTQKRSGAVRIWEDAPVIVDVVE
jgi:hypothetical protein